MTTNVILLVIGFLVTYAALSFVIAVVVSALQKNKLFFPRMDVDDSKTIAAFLPWAWPVAIPVVIVIFTTRKVIKTIARAYESSVTFLTLFIQNWRKKE